MSVSHIPIELRRLVTERAGARCEYCRLPEYIAFYPHECDHIVAEKHDGLTVLENLARTCARCNRFKGSDLGSFDPQTGLFAFFFNPRTQVWSEHFAISQDVVIGLTPIGRVTVKLLQVNTPDRIAERKQVREVGH
jgi:hypothetical protein